jgi:Domain of unknown function (DUF4288)
MAFIPENAKWYLATMVEEITVEDDSRNVVHKNYILIRADSPEEAYEKARELGKNSDTSYDNPEGKLVQIKFRGLSELNVVYDELEHGAEILYEELVGLPEEQVRALVRPKKDLGVFQPVSPKTGPDYSSREIVEEAKRLINTESDRSGD